MSNYRHFENQFALDKNIFNFEIPVRRKIISVSLNTGTFRIQSLGRC